MDSVKHLLLKIHEKVKSDKKLEEVLFQWGGRNRDKKITYMTWANAAGNHLFDDHPEQFDITESEGHHIRTFFQSSSEKTVEPQLKEIGVID